MNWGIAATLLAAAGSTIPAAGLLLLSAATRRRVLPWLVAFAAGTLLAAALVDLLPEALATGASPRAVSAAILGGMLGFLVIDFALAPAHSHSHEADTIGRGAIGPLVLFGDGLHNFIDGAAIAGAFAVSTRVGLAATLAVVAHEIPQEVSNLALLLDRGWSPRRAFLWTLAVNLVAVAGAGFATLAVGWTQGATPYVLAIACAGFLYVASADLIPGLQRGPRSVRLAQATLLFVGAATLTGLHLLLGG